MKIALVAARQIDCNITYNLTQMERFLREAKSADADLVCFGETFLQGFDCFDWNYESDRHMAVCVDSDVFQQVRRMSAEIGIDVLFGFAELDGEFYNTAAWPVSTATEAIARAMAECTAEHDKIIGYEAGMWKMEFQILYGYQGYQYVNLNDDGIPPDGFRRRF